MNSRRTFLAGLGAATLAPHALCNVLPDTTPVDHLLVPPGNGQYVLAVTSNPLLPGAAGELVLKTWLSVATDGTGVGILTDRYTAQFASHLAVQSTVQQPHGCTWQGVVTRANDPLLVGQPFTLSATTCGGAASLELVLLGQTFRGRGLITT